VVGPPVPSTPYVCAWCTDFASFGLYAPTPPPIPWAVLLLLLPLPCGSPTAYFGTRLAHPAVWGDAAAGVSMVCFLYEVAG